MAQDRVKKYGTMGVSLFFFSFIFRYILLPPIVKSQIKAQVELRPGKFMRNIWGAFPFSLTYNIYLFNITNPDEITQGQKPIVQEMGPFVYDEWQEKTNQIDHDEDDSVSFTFKYTYYFNAELSNGLTGEEEITVPNYFILGLVNALKIEKPSVIPVIGKGVDSIFRKPSSIFMKQKVKDILFDGFVINCTVKDFAGSAICSEIRAQYEDLRLKKIEDDVYLMSLFGPVNGTSSKARVRVYRGKKNLMKLGSVIEYNGKPNISVWDDEVCDALNGTDGTIFHPYYKKGDYIAIFAEALCRIISFDFLEDSKYAGVKTWRYTTSIGTDPENNPQDKCYCTNENSCPKKGAYDVYKCTKVPLLVTNPHFYEADPYYLSMVDGLSPDKEKHMLYLDIEPLTGAPLHAHSRAQLNMFMSKVEKFKLMKNVPDALLPLLWFDDVLQLPNFMLKNVKDGLRGIFMAKVSYYCMMFGGIGMSCYAAFLHFTMSQLKNNLEIKRPGQSEASKPNSSGSPAENTMTLNAGRLQAAQVPSRID